MAQCLQRNFDDPRKLPHGVKLVAEDGDVAVPIFKKQIVVQGFGATGVGRHADGLTDAGSHGVAVGTNRHIHQNGLVATIDGRPTIAAVTAAQHRAALTNRIGKAAVRYRKAEQRGIALMERGPALATVI